MAGKHGRHDASGYRALVREAKAGEGRSPSKLLDEAKGLRDPYYVALALFDLSADPKLGLKKATSAAKEALAAVFKVERLWRRAELLTTIAKKASSWRDDKATQSRERLLEDVLDAVVSMPDGQGLSDAISGCAPYIGCGRLGELLTKAVSNKGFEATDAKAVIRQWAKRCIEAGPTLEELLDVLAAVDDNAVRTRLIGYLYLQYRKSGQFTGSLAPLPAAVEAAATVRAKQRLDSLRYLAGLLSTKEELEVVSSALKSLKDPADKARFMATLGGNADKAGLKEEALRWFEEGLKVSSQVEDPHLRASIRLNLAQGLGRCGEVELATKAYQKALDDCGDNEKLIRKICRSMDNQGFELPEVCKTKELYRRDDSMAVEAEQAPGVNNILALYDTYEGGLKPVHIRAVARAAPLCVAFGLDLALMGFPTDDLEGLVSLVITDTNVGKGGKYLREMVEKGRVVLVPCTQKESPEDWNDLGLPVATTSHPTEDKKVGMAEATQFARSKHPLRRACLIMGLGKRGLPPSLLKVAPYHLELTGSNVPLETCTAMGVIAQQLRAAEK
ncbi:MAG: DUF531 family protein [Candidatus Hydrothermarchaeales archaeon]